MHAAPPIPSIASVKDSIGEQIAGHLGSLFSLMMKGPDVHGEPGLTRLLTGEQHPFGNLVVLRRTVAPDAVERALAPIVAANLPAIIIHASLTTPAAVDKVIASAGYQLAELMPAMAIDLADLRLPGLPDGYELKLPSTVPEGEQWCDALAAGYGIPHCVAAMFGPNAPQPADAPDLMLQWFSVCHGDRVVGTSMIACAGGFAGVYCVSTLAGERGKGLGAHATAAALRYAAERGYRVGILQSSAMGKSIYTRLGFTSFGEIPVWVRMPA